MITKIHEKVDRRIGPLRLHAGFTTSERSGWFAHVGSCGVFVLDFELSVWHFGVYVTVRSDEE